MLTVFKTSILYDCYNFMNIVTLPFLQCDRLFVSRSLFEEHHKAEHTVSKATQVTSHQPIRERQPVQQQRSPASPYGKSRRQAPLVPDRDAPPPRDYFPLHDRLGWLELGLIMDLDGSTIMRNLSELGEFLCLSHQQLHQHPATLCMTFRVYWRM